MCIDIDLLTKFLNDLNEEGIRVVDNDGKILVYNETMAKLEGLEVEEVLGKNLFDILSFSKDKNTLLEVLKTGKPLINELQTYFNKNGKEISTLNSTWPVKQNGQIVGAIEVARDITKIKELTEELLKLKEEPSNNGNRIVSKSKIKKYTFDDIIGKSLNLMYAKKLALRASKTSSNVLIIGESGTGKELFAQSIHNASYRRHKPFIAENCAALPESLLEGLLFGTAKGSFTGAVDRLGFFQQADGGTLMLDEINSMSLGLQSKLLRVMQEGSFRPIGGDKEIKVDVRIIAVTNDDPLKLIREGKLREDLFYRLSVVNLVIPPLRERNGDIDILTDYFIKIFKEKLGKSVKGIDNSVKQLFYRYKWPGNVRELRHVIEGAINLIKDGEKIGIQHLPFYLKSRVTNENGKKDESKRICDNSVLQRMKENKLSLDEYLKKAEEELVMDALKATHGNISKAADILGVTRQGLQYKIKKRLFAQIINE
ncbi:sigma-54 interaction domain-containing protein [Paramaledivibacter caminithermalis]|jgi:arginine utilization regulatory protein|uniref:Arginine utilization regulatory protein n=1 Tax=Paramaledivibacter caminithermalis (strain DSM 15212 / CIP 107654 / DViRD3) TaxID=1121301 RepID=A0A1M6QEA3_PARC5|nr:sigma 54-interacting transcriptional regulator [Paramaledivibacter caminithermalis]SHK18572.1 arginine utilization regulatory protein [Paramaledivibacter caminithermalis DSM 15212]